MATSPQSFTRGEALAEVQAAAAYLTSHLSTSLPRPEDFQTCLTTLLCKKYTNHWFAEDSERGSAFRSLNRIGSCLDPLIIKALRASQPGVDADKLALAMAKSMGSEKWTLWIDPGCVSIRLHEGHSNFTTAVVNADGSPSTTSKTATNGLVEIYGRLPLTLFATKDSQTPTATGSPAPATPMRTPSPNVSAITSEFLELVNATSSPAKKSRAIAIVRPKSSHTSSLDALRNTLKSTPQEAGSPALATPPRPLPSLSFTIQESTSPYVPSFENTPVTTVRRPSPIGGLINGGDRAVTPLASSCSPLAIVSSPTPIHHHSSTETISAAAANAIDLFARPSSRSSTTSMSSTSTSSEIFSHSSHESRSSSIGSYTSMNSLVSCGETTLPNGLVGASSPLQISPTELSQVTGFSFPSTSNGLTAPALPKTAPSSPSKNRVRATGSKHGHTLSASSITSAISTASSTLSTTNPREAGHGHSRGRSSQSNIRVSKAATQVQDYSNGKVGVLGGGVLLGLSGGSSERKEKKKSTNNNNGGHSRPSSANGHHGADLQAARPRSKGRTPSSSSSVSSGSGTSPNTPSWMGPGYFSNHGLGHLAGYQPPPVPSMPPQWSNGGVQY